MGGPYPGFCRVRFCTDCFGVHLWCKTELFHDCCKEEEELCLGKTLPQALSLTCRVEFETRGLYLFEKIVSPIENGMRCSSLITFPSKSRNLSGLNSSPSVQWLPFMYKGFRVNIRSSFEFTKGSSYMFDAPSYLEDFSK